MLPKAPNPDYSCDKRVGKWYHEVGDAASREGQGGRKPQRELISAPETALTLVQTLAIEALEAWARERACPRDDEQTPLEFARHLAVDFPSLGAEALQLADLYSRVAYGRERIASDRRTVLQQLWRHMRTTAGVPAPVEAKPV